MSGPKQASSAPAGAMPTIVAAKGPPPSSGSQQAVPAVVQVPSPTMKVFLREAFFIKDKGETLSPGRGIPGVTFRLAKSGGGSPTPLTGPKPTTTCAVLTAGVILSVKYAKTYVTNKAATRHKQVEASWAEVSLAGVAPGEYDLMLVPPDPSDRASPSLKGVHGKKAPHLYRPLHIKLTLKLESVSEKVKGKDVVRQQAVIVSAQEYDPSDSKHVVCHGHVTAFKGSELAIDLKPDWLETPFGATKRHVLAPNHPKKPKADIIVVHHTAGEDIGTALNQALSSSDHLGPHYEIDPEGHIVKFVDDDDVANHASPSQWLNDGGLKAADTNTNSINPRAIGIEVVHFGPWAGHPGPEVDYCEPQYPALIWLLREIVKTLDIPQHRIVGHSDVAPGAHRGADPGPRFEWTRIEEAGLGMIPVARVLSPTDYGGYFATHGDQPLRLGDGDSKQRYGGVVLKDAAGLIREVQTDLVEIGYPLPLSPDPKAPKARRPNGEFDKTMADVVARFKKHFFTGKRKALCPSLAGELERLKRQVASETPAIAADEKSVAAEEQRLKAASAEAGAAAPGDKKAAKEARNRLKAEGKKLAERKKALKKRKEDLEEAKKAVPEIEDHLENGTKPTKRVAKHINKVTNEMGQIDPVTAQYIKAVRAAVPTTPGGAPQTSTSAPATTAVPAQGGGK